MNSSILRNAAATAVVSLACGGALAANILTNGDFEQSAGVTPDGSYLKVSAGQNTILGWTVTGTSVDLIQANYGFITNVSVDLAGTPGPGGITQSFTATAGYTYKLEWDYFKNGGFGNLLVSVGSSSLNITSNPASIVYNQSLFFTAPTSGPFSVSFSTANGTNNGPVVDNIALTVAAVPEASEWAMMAAGLGMIGLIASRRRRASAG